LRDSLGGGGGNVTLEVIARDFDGIFGAAV
jgi:hypothetical protein